ncbi:hypothetical protein TL16_g06539 [Triparma laevis f. inornata]|uniref:Leucine zipper transcription factor-like protein 1 n=1 Tax=Triparma laevis f. inornata TaxID=1714386 RepID=A0A9W7AM10_9STRA|nr:hypothetical protein TL16_g06539 [Triparma laevis f. inornata]
MLNISEDHQEQVIKFIKFFRSKRDLGLEQIQCDFDDTKNDQLIEDMYTQSEVHSLFDSTSNAVKHTARTELSSVINMTVLLLAQLFESADDQGAVLEMDTSSIEDQRLLEEVEKMRLDKTAGSGSKPRLKDTLEQVKKDLMQCESDRDLAQGKLKLMGKKLKKAEKEVGKLKAKLEEKGGERGGQVEESKGGVEEGKDQENDEEVTQPSSFSSPPTWKTLGSKEAEGKEEEIDCTTLSNAQLIQRVLDLESDMKKRLMESKPFQQLKKMMTQKNKQLKNVRERLEIYEPDFVEEDNM